MRAWIAGVVAGATLAACSLTGDLSDLQSGDTGGAAGIGAGPNLCDPACQRAGLADCPNDDGATCRTDCKVESATIPASCVSAWADLLQCAASSGTYVCDAAGHAKLMNCAGAAQILEDCRHSGTGGSAGAGSGGVLGGGSGGVLGGGSGGVLGGGSGGVFGGGGSGGILGGGGSGGVLGGGGSGNVGTCPFSPCQPAGTACGDNNECCSCDCKDSKCI